jgi:hypothetical protein
MPQQRFRGDGIVFPDGQQLAIPRDAGQPRAALRSQKGDGCK